MKVIKANKLMRYHTLKDTWNFNDLSCEKYCFYFGRSILFFFERENVQRTAKSQ